MKIIRDMKGRFISFKILENIHGPKIVTLINFVNHYARKKLKEESLVIVVEERLAEIKTVVEEVQNVVGIIPCNIEDNPMVEPSYSTSETSPTATNFKVWEGKMEGEGGRVENLENNEP